jgi:tRNA threonylcarbamoyl adenosine modification protein YeaZ
MNQMKEQIFLQTALSSTFVALMRGQCVDHIPTYLDFKSDNIYVSDIGSILTRNLLKPADLQRIYVLTGPGYFTGIRAGLVIAKALQDSLHIEVGLIDSFDYLRACLPGDEDLAILIAASRKEGYLACFEGSKKVSEELISLTQLEAIQRSTKVYTETAFIQEIYAVSHVIAAPILPQKVCIVLKSEDILPHYIRSEADLFRPSQIP